MNVFKKVIISLVFALILMPRAVFGQYQFPMHPFLSYFRDLDRYELCFSASLPMGYFQGVSQVNYGSYVGDTTIKRNMTSFGFGGDIGLSLPFKATGHISCWAATIHLGVDMHTWNDLNSSYNQDGLVAPKGTALTANTMQIHLPIGIDWKVGNDAICSQRLALGCSMGGGLMPQVFMTSLSSAPNGIKSGFNFGVSPFVRVEGAFRLGWVVKVRAMYTMGEISNIEVPYALPGLTDGPFKIAHTGALMFSFVIMPFSGGWRETDWYNTHDTYNQHDRFN